MKQIITIQHTQSVHHTNGMVGSWTDWDLTELGRQQAENIGKNLKPELEGKDIIMYSSDLKRARQTAEIVGKHLGIDPILKQEIRERNLGKCCGKSVQWLRENIETPEVTVDDRLFSDGESRRDAWNRLKPFFDAVLKDEHETILVVAHGDILSSFYAMFLGLEVETYDHGDIHGLAGGVSYLLVFDNGYHCIKRMSDMSYISERSN
ncbi:MAG: histidine phosphatase family protein [Clostridiales bacterium]|nr:histidine phosphatase family protein [Clostridiales bacterium]